MSNDSEKELIMKIEKVKQLLTEAFEDHQDDCYWLTYYKIQEALEILQ